MAAMKRFDYFEPRTLDNAIALLRDAAGQATLLAGGTDLLVQIREQVRRPVQVINVKKILGLHGLAFDDDEGLRIGALATTRDLETSALVRQKYAGLNQAVTHFASIQVRNRATVVGNVCRASPSADTLPPLIADGATLELRGSHGTRMLAVEDFCTGPGRTQRAADEIVTLLRVPPPAPHTGKAYLKHGRRVEMELATVGVAVSLQRDGDTCRDLRIVLAAVAPTPLRSRQAEAALRGRCLDDAGLDAAARGAMDEARPIGDVRGSADYRRRMVGVLTRRAIEQAWREAA
jgi:carbon-monoxide dehydrogenase medium subunit